ncbi:MAG: glucose-1-phosphate thymidylyltransferase RfbA [Clostridia bacterium]|nr:glucose-1-phosphate thymidylyltransferase RfbA [Clostridia bacterium]
MNRLDSLYIGDILKRARENNDLTQEEVAEELGIGRDAIIRIEKGSRKIAVEELQRLIRIYNLNVEDILFSEEETSAEDVKGIILAGGSGTRLYPITKAESKQLISVYDKPMVYYPLSVLMQAGIKDILIITTPEDQAGFKRLLGDGKQFGINLQYAVQPSPDGLAQAFIIGEEFIGNSSCAMVLGDNIFYGNGLTRELKRAIANAKNDVATIYGYQVKDPERFGIMELDEHNNVLSVEEKPTNPKSDYAITGLYFYPSGVSKKAKAIKPSARGELEITSLNDLYLQENKLKACLLGEGYSWFDTGTFDSLLDASNMIRTIQNNRDAVICCPEKIAYEHGWINDVQIENAANELKKNSYGKYLSKIMGK